MGFEAMPWETQFGPYIRWEDLLMVFFVWVSHMVLGMMVFCPYYFLDLSRELWLCSNPDFNGLGFMNASTCIYMYCSIEGT